MTTNDKPVKINASFEQAMRFFATQPDVKSRISEDVSVSGTSQSKGAESDATDRGKGTPRQMEGEG